MGDARPYPHAYAHALVVGGKQSRRERGRPGTDLVAAGPTLDERRPP